MSQFLAPVGHFSQPVVLILAETVGCQLSIQPPDPDLKDAVLTTQDGFTVKSTPAVVKYICQTGPSNGLYGDLDALLASQVDQWIDVATFLDVLARNWVEPFRQSAQYDDASRAASKAQITSYLDSLERCLADRTYLVSERITLADIVLVGCVRPIFEGVLGEQDRHPYDNVVRWLSTCCAFPSFVKVLGGLRLNSKATGWEPPKVASKKEKKKKKGGNTESQQQQQQAKPVGEEDPEKKAKKAAKQAAKEAKKAKAKAKADKFPTAQPNSKKAQAKAEAEAKRKAEAAEEARIIALARATPKGEKKDTTMEMPKGYCPAAVEAGWYDWWEKSGFFKPDPKSTKPPFVIVIPPPNVTGALHIGHALTNAIEDTVVRWRRMSGYNTLWVPGTDHAGIATQTVVEKKIHREQGITRHDLGREGFLEEVHKWVANYKGQIHDQLMRIGSSADWSRERFTMDDVLSKAVKEAFVRLYDDDLVYRDNRLVNWCCKLRTALSDIEVDYIDIPKRTMITVPGFKNLVEFGVLTSFAYPLEEGDGEIVVATTRPETMLGDTAVAVHPDDPRYKHLHGKFAVHPVNGRKIPIITDAVLVEMDFGTGAVKITPAHDPNDYQTGKRHNLEFISVFDDDGMVNGNGSQFEGQHRFEARVTVVDFLKEKGLFRGVEDNPMRLGLCSRSKDVIEPILKPQWWVNCQQMGADACEAVRDGRLEIIPKEYEATWFRWLENIRDWCVSRQLWWGHRIPAYYVIFDGEKEGDSGLPGLQSEKLDRWVVGRSMEEAEGRAKAKFSGKSFRLEQDDDVLDTWFSSGLFPFSVFSWPDTTEDLEKFYPTSLLETGHDILFFWVARMVMMGMKLTGQVPFKQVYLHSMVRDAHGRKMSKSLGNVIDPVHVIEGISLEGLHETLMGGNIDAKEIEKAKAGQKADFPSGIAECGTDALRFALVSYTSQSGDINLDIKRVVAYRHWCNKLWNAIKFAMINLPEGFVPSLDLDIPLFPMPCRWILSRLSNTVKSAIANMTAYELGLATQAIYAFWQDNVCDVFIELMKPVMLLDDSTPDNVQKKLQTRETLWICLDYGLRLLQPFMPFVSEELWQRLPKRADQQDTPSIIIAPYPTVEESWMSSELESDMAYINNIVSRTRQMRADYSLTTKQNPELYIVCKDDRLKTVLKLAVAEIAKLSYSSTATVLDDGAPPIGCSVAILDASTTVHLQLKGILDADKELQKLAKKLQDAEKQINQLEKNMALPSYVEKTPENIKAEDQAKLATKKTELEHIHGCITSMEELKKSG